MSRVLRPAFTRVLVLVLCLAGCPLAAQSQDGLAMLPETYRLQFENEWVRLVRVHLAGNAHLPKHSHPAGLIVYLYLSDSEPVQFNHDERPGNISRRAVTARSYRIGRATPEVHEVVNSGASASDWLRIELKTVGSDSPRQRIVAPALATADARLVEATSESLRVSRLTVAAGSRVEIAAAAERPTVLVALTAGMTTANGQAAPLALGQERFVAPGGRVSLRNEGPAAIELLRVDLLADRQQ